ncbi:MAG: pyruvate formate lyase family protein, partial [Clostridiales Family XIII bacterium]|nr:pyruvate formate lyase family protein [Clostridiales Family XIII bacterium]
MRPKALSQRIAYLADRFEEDYRAQRDLDERGQVYREVFRAHEGESAARKTALGLCAFLEKKRILVREYDLLAGNVEYYDYTDTLPYHNRKVDKHLYGAGNADPFATDIEIERCMALKALAAGSPEAALLGRFQHACDCRLFVRWGSGHLVAGYRKLVAHGLAATIREGEACLERHGADRERRECVENMLMVCRAAQGYFLRYADQALALAHETRSPDWRKSLLRISNACRNLTEKPAADFFEAVQMVLLVHDVIVCESQSGSLSLGRLDQLLYPYYERDLGSGRITEGEAQDLICALWLKLSRMREGFQNVTLGGCDRLGRFAGNAVTLFCLKASYDIRMDQPLVSLRCTKDMPDAFWEEAVALMRTGTGFPALFNDD